MTTFILVLIIISLLILAHELGHFYSARKLGVRVDEFGFGFPPKLWSRTKNGVLYTINLLPFGGFVKIYGEHGEGTGDKNSFISKSAWRRFVILAAGVFMNLVLAWLFFTAGNLVGVPEITDGQPKDVPVSIVGVVPNSPADNSGLKFGDKILEMQGKDITLRINSEKDVQDFIDAYRGEDIILTVERGQQILKINTKPRVTYPEGEGPLGIALARLTIRHIVWYKALWEGAKTLLRGIILTIEGLFFLIKQVFIERNTQVAVSGPIGIFQLIGDTQTLGPSYLLQLIGMLSVNLAILNFLPIPALDGGRILFLLIEKIKGKKIDPHWENMAHAAGFAFLILVMILVTYKDIVRVF